MQMMPRFRAEIVALLMTCSSPLAMAGAADVIVAKARREPDGTLKLS